MDRSVLVGFAWSGAAKWSTQIISWAGTIIVARILTPSDYGLLSMATVFLSLIYALSEFGVGTAVVTLRDLSEDVLRQLNGFTIVLGLCGTIVTVFLAGPLGAFFRAPELPPVLITLGLTFSIISLQTVPAALLRRDFEFRKLAIVDVTRGVVLPVVTLIGALAGLRYWALALGNVASAVITATMTLYFRRIQVARPRTSQLRAVLGFSRNVLIGRLAWIIYQDGDFAVAGRRLGQAAVGDYSLAWTIATSPIDKITNVLSGVTPTMFGAVQHDRPALTRYFLNLSEMLCLITVPASVGMALVSNDLVSVVLGSKWSGAAAPLALLALYAGARSLTDLYDHLFNATKETWFGMWISVARAFLLLTGFIIGSHWGAVGIAASWLIVHPLVSLVSFTRVRSVLDLSSSRYLKALRLGLDGTVAMGATVLGFQMLLAPDWAPITRLLASILSGAVTYILVTWLLHSGRLKHIYAWVKRIRSGGGQEA